MNLLFRPKENTKNGSLTTMPVECLDYLLVRDGHQCPVCTRDGRKTFPAPQ